MKTSHDLKFLENSTETLRAVAHPARIEIISLLYHQGASTVTEIHEALAIEQAVASHHLRILKGKGVVEATRKGKNSYYALTNKEFYTIIGTLRNLLA
ncbi:MAG: metalloregulator ArsR/SmtB family transcription factor [Bacteroidota bacterium]